MRRVLVLAVGTAMLLPASAAAAKPERILYAHSAVFRCPDGKFGRPTISVKIKGRMVRMRVVPNGRPRFLTYRSGFAKARVHTTPAKHQQRVQNWSGRSIYYRPHC